jgi:outer membrane lipoprotein-sorting protein
MSPVGSRRAVVLGVALISLSVAAIGVGTVWVLTDSGDSRPIGVNASEQAADLEGVSGTVETVRVEDNRTVRRTVQQVKKRPGTGESRVDTVVGPESKRWLIVSNGSTTWEYSPQRDYVRKSVRPKVVVSGEPSIDRPRSERVERLFRLLNVSRSAAGRTERVNATGRVSPLPVVPRGDTATPASVNLSKGWFRLEYAGLDRVAGREVYVVRIEHLDGDGPGRTVDYRQTLAVDTEWFVVLERQTEVTVDGEQVEQTRTYRNVTFNPELDGDEFTFDPPPNTTVETVEPAHDTVYRYGSLAGLRADLETSVPRPDLPATFAFQGAVRRGQTSVELRYGNATTQVAVSKNRAGGLTSRDTAGGTVVEIDGHEAVYQQYGVSQSLSWRCGEYRYLVSTEGASRALLTDVAESVACG